MWPYGLEASLSMGFSRQEYWNGLPFPSPEDLPNPAIKPRSPALAGLFTTEPPGKLYVSDIFVCIWLTSLCKTVFRSIYITTNDPTSLLFMAEQYSIVYMYHVFFKHFLCWWTFKLLPCPSYCKQCWNEQWSTCIFLNHGFLWIYAQEWDCWIISCGSSIFNFIRNLCGLPRWC